jgi:hypothetical protein
MSSRKRLVFDLPSQPTLTSCGPTCLRGIYRYFEDTVSLETLMEEVPELEEGGTLAVFLGQHALRRGYKVELYSYNLRVFDPTWTKLDKKRLCEKLMARYEHVQEPKLKIAVKAYHEFLRLGGKLKFADLNASLVRKYLRKDIPILTGLSSTYLYQSCREIPATCRDDDIRGEPAGHFVVLTGYNHAEREAYVADPYLDNPIGELQSYSVCFDRLINSILMGTYTFDANLVCIYPSN